MTVNDDFDDNDLDLDAPPEGERSDKEWARLRRQQQQSEKQAKETAAELEQVRRERAFEKAGINVDSKLGKLFSQTYEGPLEPDAIRAEASELSPELATMQEVPPPTSLEDDGSTGERRALVDGAPGDTGEGVDPRQSALQNAQAIIEKGGTFEEGTGTFLNGLVQAAVAGDQRVMVRGRFDT